MTTDRFTTTCPSCEASFAVRTASAGKKIECPKCKFRFVADAPAGSGGDAPKAAKGGKKGDKAAAKADPKGKKAKAGGGNTKVLVGVLVGVLALAGLAVGAFLIFGGDSKPTEQAKNPPQQRPGGPGGPTPAGGEQPGEPMEPGEPMATDPKPPDAGEPVKPDVKTAVKQVAKATGANVTNLLPKDAKSVFHGNMDELAKTDLKKMFFDRDNKKMFRESLRFDSDDVAEFVHCYVGTDFHPFVVVRTKSDLPQKIISVPEMDTTLPGNSPINGKWHFREIRSNAFVTAVANAVSIPELLNLPAPAAAPSGAADTRKYAVSLYDTRTLLIGETNTLQRFLTDLKDNGFPEYQSEYNKPVIEEPKPEGEGGGEPGGQPMGEGGAPAGPQGGPGGGGDGARRGGGQQGGGPPQGGGGDGARRGGGPQGGPPGGPPGSGIPPGGITLGGLGGPGGPGGGPGGPPPPRAAQKPINSNPHYRTIHKDLKKALNRMQDEAVDQTAVLYATTVNQRAVNLYRNAEELKALLPGVDNPAFDIISKVKIAGLAMTRLTSAKGSFVGYLDYATDDAAKAALTENVMPVLTLARLAYFTKFREPLAVVNANDGGGGLDQPGEFPGGFPGGPPGGGPGGRPGGPGGLPPGGLSPLPPPGSPGGGGRDPDAQSPRGGRGGGSDDAMQRPGMPGGGGGQPGGLNPLPPPGSPAGGPGGPGGSPDGGPGGFPGEGGMIPTSPTPTGSRVVVEQANSVITLTAEFLWKKEGYDLHVRDPLSRAIGQLRGKMAVFSGEATVFAFADRDGAPGALNRALKGRNGQFPQGALDRDAESDRRGLPHPPEQRLSFFVDLLPYLGERSALYSQFDKDTMKKQPWYSPDHLRVAETWIPELLVPDYPPSAWRATNDLIPDGRYVGGTNFVGVAGVGLDAARMDPKNKADAAKVGLLGYNFSSKPEDVKDGLANTMFLIQVPPGLPRPWIAGGGATLQGVDDKGADPVRPFLSKRADGSRTTTVLMGDGSVRTVREGIDPAVFRGMATRAGGETIPELDKTAPKAGPGGVNELRTGK